ncbi:hypothetical protein J7T55_015392 [Diaporthe amygdali]|uniref:uncharacterized protein n=1 Tax=Phomopsis amygdali TaxID=1214568 RepID=UPI0022FE1D01|nr:uncharacterized protein J7T55_015392 [Diaporthe amygdali]KAJ0120661.1 hypothetical protein J7T55_015392 [Diaporthe amygdali]
MFTRLPRLQEIYYEPWRDWVPENPLITRKEFEALFTSLASKDLQKLVVFENFHSSVPIIDPGLGHICALIRAASRMAAETSLKLEHFSGSFLIDASEFFASCKSSWTWSKLRSLTVTSQKLTAGEDQPAISEMLRIAAAAAMNMSRLDTLEIWNGKSKSATLFKYQSNRGQTYAALTWRSTWGFVIEPSVIQAWMSVAYKHGARGLTSCTELLDVRDKVKFHGDAIRYLQLSQPVARPVSLTQIRVEQVIHDHWDKWQKKRRKEFLDHMIREADPDNREHQQVLADLRARFRDDEEEEREGNQSD